MKLTDYNEVTALLKRHNFHFSKSMGQNFLTADWVPERIAAEAMIEPEDGVVEIGPGVGCLTVELAKYAKRVVSLELDRSLEDVLAETLSDCPNAEVIFADALRTDLRALCEEKLGDCKAWRVCANVPYNVTSPLLTAFLEAGCFASVTVMIQKEVAERICAAPGTGEYGAFTVLVNWYAETEKLFDVPKSCFVPQPKVTSSVIRLNARKERPAAVKDERFFFRVVRAAFGQRRKTLPNAITAGVQNLSRADIEAALAELGLPAQTRGETLSVEQFAALSDALLEKMP